MCGHGTDTLLTVIVPARLSYTGKDRKAVKGIDSCIAPLVQALNSAGIYTANSCCGHGREDGWITLHDGRMLVITTCR